jgi:hypothetical protein
VDQNPVGKVSARLSERLHAEPALETVEVIVELRPLRPADTGSRKDRIAALRDEFELEAAPVADRIAEVGGEVLGTAWINQTVRGRIPPSAVERVAAADAVISIDLPRPLEATD